MQARPVTPSGAFDALCGESKSVLAAYYTCLANGYQVAVQSYVLMGIIERCERNAAGHRQGRNALSFIQIKGKPAHLNGHVLIRGPQNDLVNQWCGRHLVG